MRKFANSGGSSIIFVVALLLLSMSLATILLGMMQGDEGSSRTYLLLLGLGMALATFVLVIISALRLLFGGLSLGSSRAERRASAPSHTGTSKLARASSLEDGRWMKLVEECVEVLDELDEHMSSFDAPRRELAEHMMVRLEEILGRSGVEIISNDTIFDRARHKPDMDHATTGNGATIHETLSPGFAVGPRILRRAWVQLGDDRRLPDQALIDEPNRNEHTRNGTNREGSKIGEKHDR